MPFLTPNQQRHSTGGISSNLGTNAVLTAELLSVWLGQVVRLFTFVTEGQKVIAGRSLLEQMEEKERPGTG